MEDYSESVIDPATQLAAELLVEFDENHRLIVGFLDYPFNQRDNEQAIRQWLYRKVQPMAAYMRKTARQFSQPYGELTETDFTAALIDELFRDGTMRTIYNKINALNPQPEDKQIIPTELGGAGENPYDGIIYPTPLSFKLTQFRWWQSPQMLHLVEQLQQTYERNLI